MQQFLFACFVEKNIAKMDPKHKKQQQAQQKLLKTFTKMDMKAHAIEQMKMRRFVQFAQTYKKPSVHDLLPRMDNLLTEKYNSEYEKMRQENQRKRKDELEDLQEQLDTMQRERNNKKRRFGEYELEHKVDELNQNNNNNSQNNNNNSMNEKSDIEKKSNDKDKYGYISDEDNVIASNEMKIYRKHLRHGVRFNLVSHLTLLHYMASLLCPAYRKAKFFEDDEDGKYTKADALAMRKLASDWILYYAVKVQYLKDLKEVLNEVIVPNAKQTDSQAKEKEIQDRIRSVKKGQGHHSLSLLSHSSSSSSLYSSPK